jgi:Yip1-like protein
MPDTATALANDQDSPSLSQFERVVDTFIEPSKTFNDIKRNRSWWLPFVIIAVLGYIFCFVAVQHVGWNSMVTNVMKSNPKTAARLEQQTPAQQAQTFAVTKGFIEGFMAGGPVVVLVMNALFALVLWGCFAFLLGGATNYGEMFAVSIFASLPAALATLIAIATVFASDPQTYNLNLPSPAALAYYLDPSTPAWLLSIGKSLDIFSLWSLALSGFGGAIVAKVKPLRGVLLVFGLWLLFVVVKTGLAAAFS